MSTSNSLPAQETTQDVDTKANRLRVDFGDGKYTVMQESSGGLRFLRHNEPWPAADEQFAHVGMILALAQDLDDARCSLGVLLKAVDAVIDASSDYLPPDGISKDEFINRVIGATDNAEIVAVLKTLA